MAELGMLLVLLFLMTWMHYLKKIRMFLVFRSMIGICWRLEIWLKEMVISIEGLKVLKKD